jgi:hypothetical protein
MYPYNDLAANVCKMCNKLDRTFCKGAFPHKDYIYPALHSCEVYDELRNCIFARSGYVFAKPKWQKEFAQKPWYKPDPKFTQDKLSPVARDNVRRLQDLKAKRQDCQ